MCSNIAYVCILNDFQKVIWIIFKGVNGQYVWFCVDQPCLKDYYVFFDPLVWIAQYVCAEDFIIMPIWAFIKMASGQDPDVIISLFPSEVCTICI